MKQHLYTSSIIGIIIAAICIGYFVLLEINTNMSGGFRYIWLAAGIYFLGFSTIAHLYNNEILAVPRFLYWLFIYFAVAVVVLIGCAIGVVTVHKNAMPPEQAPYMIVLGAKLEGNEASDTLKCRLDGAITYLEENPETVCIVSGGQGTDEICPEAMVMKQYMVSHGIASNRILEEDKSRNTMENLTFSKAMIEDTKSTVVIVTNGFHIYRALEMAEDVGLNHAVGLGTTSDPLLVPYNYVREAAAVIKYRLSSFMK